jgi:hypothetical protein
MASFPFERHGFPRTGLVGAVGIGLAAALTAMPIWAGDQDNTRATVRAERQESRAAASSERASSAPSSSSSTHGTPSNSPPSTSTSSGATAYSAPSTPTYTRGSDAQQRSESTPAAGRGGSIYVDGGASYGPTSANQVASDRGRDGGRDRGRGRGHGRDGDRHRGGHRGRHHGGGIYIGGYYPGYYGGYYPGYCRWCWGGYPWGGGTIIVEGGGGYGYGRNTGALDLDVAPERAEVYINGDYGGRADDYDGWPAFLWLEAGTYDIVLYHEGYRTIARQYTVRPGVVIDVQDEMQPGDAVRPEDLPSRSTVNRDERIRRNEERDVEVTQREQDAARRAARVEAGSDRAETEQAVGRIYLSLWPDDAAVYLDGHFLGTAGEIGQLSAGLVVEPGEHRLEVVHPGFKTEQRTVNVPSGERVEVKFDLNEN